MCWLLGLSALFFGACFGLLAAGLAMAAKKEPPAMD